MIRRWLAARRLPKETAKLRSMTLALHSYEERVECASPYPSIAVRLQREKVSKLARAAGEGDT